MAPLISGIAAIGLGMTTLVAPAYADGEPFLEPKVGQEKPIVKEKEQKKKKRRFKEPAIFEPKPFEPQKPRKHKERKKQDVEVEPKPQLEEPAIVEAPKAEAPRVEAPKTPTKQRLEMPEKKEKHQEQAKSVVPSNDKTYELKIPKISPEFTVEPLAAAGSAETVTTAQTVQKDTTPIQPTENGGELPKTAGNHMNWVIGGLLLIAGGYQLKRYRELNA